MLVHVFISSKIWHDPNHAQNKKSLHLTNAHKKISHLYNASLLVSTTTNHNSNDHGRYKALHFTLLTLETRILLSTRFCPRTIYFGHFHYSYSLRICSRIWTACHESIPRLHICISIVEASYFQFVGEIPFWLLIISVWLVIFSAKLEKSVSVLSLEEIAISTFFSVWLAIFS